MRAHPVLSALTARRLNRKAGDTATPCMPINCNARRFRGKTHSDYTQDIRCANFIRAFAISAFVVAPVLRAIACGDRVHVPLLYLYQSSVLCHVVYKRVNVFFATCSKQQHTPS